MVKNNKGFSLMELITVMLMLTVLLSIGLPQYRASTRKTQIAAQLPIMKALQDDIINFYNLNGSLPTRLFQLSLNRSDFNKLNGNETSAVHNTSRCVFSLKDGGATAEVDCNQGWHISYSVIATSKTIKPGQKLFEIDDDIALYGKIADNLGWQPLSKNSFRII